MSVQILQGVSAQEKRRARYIVELDEIIQRAVRLDAATLARMYATLDDARRELADLVLTTDWSVAHFAVLETRIARTMEQLATELNITMGMYQQGRALSAMVDMDRLLETFGGEREKLDIGLNLTDIAIEQDYSAVRLLTEVSDEVRANTGDAIRNGMLQGKNPTDILEEIGARLVDEDGNPAPGIWGSTVTRAECLSGDTLVTGAVVRAVFRRWYEGPAIVLHTAMGRQFTATPNHPMLTKRGWIAASFLDETDDLICDDRKQDVGPSRDNHVDQAPATLREIFNTLALMGRHDKSRGNADDFHGDGREGEVDILRPDGVLTFGEFTSLDEPLIQRVFPEADAAAFRFCAECRSLLPIDKAMRVRAGAELLSSPGQAIKYRLYGHAVEAGQLASRHPTAVAVDDVIDLEGDGVRTLASGYPLLPDDVANHSLTDAEHRCDLPRRETRGIEADRVVSVVRIVRWAGHVFNLQTDCGYYIANGVFTGNTILRTEGNRIYSASAHARNVQADQRLPGLREAWIHSGKSTGRPSHIRAEDEYGVGGRPKLVGEMFKLRVGSDEATKQTPAGTYECKYPRDPRLPAAASVGCGCHVAPYREGWDLGDLA